MKKLLIPFVKGLKSNKKLGSFDEASIKQAVVMKLLSLIGWDIFDVDEVVPDYSIKSQVVDFSLKIDGSNMVFISVIKPGEDMDDHQEKLLDFAYQEKVALSILTNGPNFRFYLSSMDDSPEEKMFYTFDISEQMPEEISSKITEFLSKGNITKGTAIEAAENQYNAQKQEIAEESIPEAWLKLLSDQDEKLVVLLMEATGDICGYEPDKEMVENFLAEQHDILVGNTQPEPVKASSNKPKTKESDTRTTKEAAAPAPKKQKKAPVNYNGKLITSFSLKDKTYNVDSWDDMMISLCGIMVAAHKDDFDKVLWSTSQNRSFFSRTDGDLRHPERIPHTSIFVEVNLSPNDTVKLAQSVLAAFDYPASDLKINCKDGN